jgi:hypothetical protein
MRYKAKIDWWIGASMLCGIAIPSVIAIVRAWPWMCVPSVCAALLVFGYCYPQWYETAADALVIRAGWTTRRIPYPAITAVRPSSDSRSSLAMSLDRVEIEYGTTALLIAPVDQEAFFADIAGMAPQLSRQGQGLVVPLASLA